MEVSMHYDYAILFQLESIWVRTHRFSFSSGLQPAKNEPEPSFRAGVSMKNGCSVPVESRKSSRFVNPSNVSA
ncbi:unnamed protein product [Nezara viridula]|uniref:Uncharacterized protein n=1 Tax=Nezara viridula TaxID=85310 RepID=A0A9P0EAF9_NEZVI|nr:unnamed protein product [Nezara viridula]